MKPSAVYHYRNGPIEFLKERYDDRKAGRADGPAFIWKHRTAPDSFNGEELPWKAGRGAVRPWLYQRERVAARLREFPAEIVFWVEGEKKVDRLWQEEFSFFATSPLDGANAELRDEDVDFLAGAMVVVLPDNDAAGQGHADRVIEGLRRAGADVAVRVDLPGLRDGEDICEWLDVHGHTADELLALVFPPIQAALRERVSASDGAAILDESSRYVRRHVVLSEAQADAVALWTVNTHVFDASDFVPYLGITSAEKRSGKSRLLDVLSHLVARPWRYDNASDAVFFRKIEAERSTVLFDEADSLFKKVDERPETRVTEHDSSSARQGSLLPPHPSSETHTLAGATPAGVPIGRRSRCAPD